MEFKSILPKSFKLKSFSQKKISFAAVLLLGILITYFAYICYINLACAPSFYCTDMYTDILYAVRAWEAKSLFPDGWIFGNQLYVIATPALAALIYGIVGNPALAMAWASIIMTLGVFLSYLFMMKPVFPKLEDRLIGLICFVALVSYCGDAVFKIKGWQLFFTICSYYSCYVITAFLCFGCFLRREEEFNWRSLSLFAASVLLAFGAGVQSLRQTAIMLVPMVAVEAIQQLWSIIRHKKVLWQGIIVTGSITAANLLGLWVGRSIDVPRNELFTSSALLPKEKIPEAINNSFTTLMGLLTDKEYFGVLFIMAVVVLALCIVQAKLKKASAPSGWGTLIALFAFSVLSILAIDMYTEMHVRSTYHFMLYPLISLLPVYAYRNWKLGKVLSLLLIAMLITGSFKNAVLPAVETAKNDKTNISYEISEMLTEKGYTTIYSGWNHCENIAIASGGKLEAGFWNSSKDVFNPVMCLCDPAIYEVDSSKCVYYLRRENKDIAIAKAEEKGVTMTLVKEYPQLGVWIYEASENLMTPEGE